MTNTDSIDPLFREAVNAIDAGDITHLEELLHANPHLVCQCLDVPDEGYFQRPYLIWFIADNPIRHERLPANIVEITNLLLFFLKKESPDSYQLQIDYTLGLVATGRIPRECGVQIELMDILMAAGAHAGDGLGALAHGNIEAAEHLVEKGIKVDLATAIGIDRKEDIKRLFPTATTKQKQEALVVAAFYGKAEMLSMLIREGVDVNAYIDQSSGFHWHATALHQAVYSASLDAVKVLINAGASTELKDKIYGGTAIGWAAYMQKEAANAEAIAKYNEIENYLNQLRH
jgi:peptide-methionine (S)-S-oxide reductase